ncbi:MAG: S-layer homology domain [Phormidesmis priestleyi Ana]|uniref:S-layer homology domain n=1 Tax=Phormidesmis priestleyi Ana TaxID=1666911 RepID=A0A0P7ZGM8_9CYAN|nr:MAG: S-layer homology domain [Phormidesmis priestleyi Ana]
MRLFQIGSLVAYSLALGVLANSARADSGSPLPTRSFADMQQHWAKDCVSRLSASHQISGYPNGQFRPEAQVTRAEFAVLMLNSFPTLTQSTPQLTRSFRDVRRNHWAYSALQTAYQKGIFVGYPDGTMRPDQSISRVEAIATLVSLVNRTYDVYDTGFLPTPPNADAVLKALFVDFDQIPAWSKPAAATAASGFLVVDYPQGDRFRPAQASSRAEIAAVLCQAQQWDGLVPVEAVAGNQHFDWSPGLKALQKASTEGIWVWFNWQREQLVIPALPQTSILSLSPPVETLALVSVKGEDGNALYGYLNENGQVAIAPQFSFAENFSSGRALVYDSRKNRYGFIDANGRLVIPVQYASARSFQEGLAAVFDGENCWCWGFIDPTGALVLPFQYSAVGNFSEGLAWVNTLPGMNERYGFINRSGQMVIADRFGAVESFYDGLAAVYQSAADGLPPRTGYIDHAGQWAEPPAPFQGIEVSLQRSTLRHDRWEASPNRRSYNDQGFRVDQRDNKFGIVNRQGEFVIAPIYAAVTFREEGYARVNYGGVQVSVLEGNDGMGSPLPGTRLVGGRWGYVKIPTAPY